MAGLLRKISSMATELMGKPVNPDDGLRNAVEAGDLAAAQKYIRLGADVSPKSEPGRMAPLYLAVIKNDLPMVNILLTLGANADCGLAGDQEGTGLTQACKRGYADIAKALLDHDASINLREYSRTPLHEAINNGHDVIARELISRGADMTICDRNGHPPLQAAMVKGNKSLVLSMIENGVDVENENQAGLTMRDLIRGTDGWQAAVEALKVRDEKAAKDKQAQLDAVQDLAAGIASIAVLKRDIVPMRTVQFKRA